MTISTVSLVSDEEFYDFYSKAIAAKTDADYPAIVDGKPQGGWYRLRANKASPWSRVEIWRDATEIIIEINGERAPDADYGRTWAYCAKHAISVETFDYHAEHGLWPGQDAPPAAGSEIGGNAPPQEDLLAMLKEKIEAATKWFESIGKKVTEHAQIEAIANRCGSIAELRLKVDKAYRAEKDPINKLAQEIDDRYSKPIKGAAAMEKALKQAGEVFVNEENRKERERAAAEARRVAEEEAARRAKEAETAKVDEPKHSEPSNVVPLAPAPAPTPAPAPAAPASYGGAVGRKLKAKPKKVAVITDINALFQFVKDEPEVIAVLQKLAQNCVDNSITCPGVTAEEQVKLA